MSDVGAKGAVPLIRWPLIQKAGAELPAQELSSVWFLIGTISSRSDITGVMAEVMGTRWWRATSEHSSLHLQSLWFSFVSLLIFRSSGFSRLCCNYHDLFFFSLSLCSNTFAEVAIDPRDQLTFHSVDRLICALSWVKWLVASSDL